MPLVWRNKNIFGSWWKDNKNKTNKKRGGRNWATHLWQDFSKLRNNYSVHLSNWLLMSGKTSLNALNPNKNVLFHRGDFLLSFPKEINFIFFYHYGNQYYFSWESYPGDLNHVLQWASYYIHAIPAPIFLASEFLWSQYCVLVIQLLKISHFSLCYE